MSKLFITGGAGFIGSQLIRQAIENGHQVLNFDALTYAANLDNLASIADHPNYQFTHANICDQNAVRQAFANFKPDALINLAAETHVDKSIDEAGDFIKTNVEGTRVLLDEARNYWQNLENAAKDNFRFLHVSTDEVYGDLGADDSAFSETTPYAPSSPYAASKAASDHLVRAWHRTYGLPILITNCSNNYGPYQFPEKLIPMVVIKALAGEKIPVYGTGENVRDWLHVADHASAIMAVLARGKSGETYNIGGDNERTNIDLVREICACLNDISPSIKGDYARLISFTDDRPGHDRRYAIDNTKICAQLGWTPTTQPADGLKQTVRWYVDNPKWREAILVRGDAVRRQGSQKGRKNS